MNKQHSRIRVNNLKTNKRNPKLHNDELIKSSIEELGFVDDIVVDEDNMILAGHGRLKALKKLGDKEVDVIKITGWTDKQKEKYLLLSNKSVESGGWDDDLLKEFDKDLLSEVGFSSEELDKLLDLEPDEKDDEVPEVPEEPKSKLGEIYQLGRHRIMCGDSTKIEDVEKLMDGKKADMYLSDPPYNVDYEGKTKDALKIENDKKTDDDFRQFLRDAFSTVDINLKPGAVFYIWHADSEGYNFRGACHDNNWKVRQCLIWNKNSMVMGRQDYHWKHEPCLYGWKDGAGHLWATDRKQTTILNFDRPSRSTEHPTMKPVELLSYQVCNNTKGEDIVLDTFLGSGSTLIACEKTNRICYGMEIDPRYIDVIIKRWEDYTGGKAKKIG